MSRPNDQVSTPRTDAKRFKMISDLQSGYRYVVAADFAMELEREAMFYRGLLQQVCEDSRKTRARRLAESGLMFWDSMELEKSKRANNQAQARRA